ncbi:MAG: hypothetical protein ABIJ96_11830 [Elusimicrobiota bacterium]
MSSTEPDSESGPPETAASGLRRAEQQALEAVRDRLQQIEDRSLDNWRVSAGRYRDAVSDLMRRLREARRNLEAAAETFRAKLLSGPVGEDEFRARTVLLEMEYEGRLKLAEEGCGLLTRMFEECSDREEERIRSVRGELLDAARPRLELDPAALAEPIAERDRRIKMLAEELDAARTALRRARDDAAGARAALEEVRAGKQAGLDEALREKERALERAQDAEASMRALREKELELEEARASLRARALDCADLEEKERLAGESIAEIARLREAALQQNRLHEERVARMRQVMENAWEKLLDLSRLRARLEEAVRVREEAEVECQRVSRQRGRVEEERDEALAEVTRLERALFEAREDVLALREKVDAANAQRRAVEKELGSARKCVDELERETEAARAELAAVQGAEPTDAAVLAEAAALRSKLADAAEACGERDDLRRQLGESDQARRAAAAELAQAREQLAVQQERLSQLQKSCLTADVGRDRKKAESEREWVREKEDYEERLSQAVREYNTLETMFKDTQRAWEESYARQDKERMNEIFRLKAEVERLRGKNDGGK